MMQRRGIFFILLLALAFIDIAVSGAVKGTGSCPIKETIKNCLPKCISDFECIGYKRCCPNACNSKSCADISPVYTGNDPRHEENEGIICGNVKCQPRQKCISDGSMKKPKCSW